MTKRDTDDISIGRALLGAYHEDFGPVSDAAIKTSLDAMRARAARAAVAAEVESAVGQRLERFLQMPVTPGTLDEIRRTVADALRGFIADRKIPAVDLGEVRVVQDHKRVDIVLPEELRRFLEGVTTVSDDNDDLRARAERLAMEATGEPYSAVLARIDRGELRGTIIESELLMIRHLLEGLESGAATARAAEKAASRAADAEALATGTKTREQLRAENGHFRGIAHEPIRWDDQDD